MKSMGLEAFKQKLLLLNQFKASFLRHSPICISLLELYTKCIKLEVASTYMKVAASPPCLLKILHMVLTVLETI